MTLGIPRLQEILMTAKEDIRTPIMTCPLFHHIEKCVLGKLFQLSDFAVYLITSSASCDDILLLLQGRC